MKQTVRIAGGINEFFGTLDENLKYFESTLKVRTHLKDHNLEIEGEAKQVERACHGAFRGRHPPRTEQQGGATPDPRVAERQPRGLPGPSTRGPASGLTA